MLRLGETHTRALLDQPESGMGYQFVETTFRDNTIARGIAYNAELVFLGDESQSILQTTSHRDALRVAKAASEEITSIRAISAAALSRLWPTAVREVRESSEAKPAQDGAVEKTKNEDTFIRFSAYQNDRRVTAAGALLPGTYATTEADARNVSIGKDAVARYALPNPQPASHRFTIKPKTDTDIQYGTVQPAYGQPGGGVEVVFPIGTQPSTVTGPDKIPDQ